MPYLTLHAHGQELARHDLTGPLVIGRCPECDIAVRDVLLSRRHCRIEAARGGWRIVDLDSRNGTRLGERRLRQHQLRDGQTLRLGRTQLTFHARAFTPAPLSPLPSVVDTVKSMRPADPFEALAGTVLGLRYIDPHEQESPDEVEHEPADESQPVDRPIPSGAVRYGAEEGLLIQLAADVATWRQQAIGTAILAGHRERSLPQSRRIRPVYAMLPNAGFGGSIVRPAATDLSLQLLSHVDAPTPALHRQQAPLQPRGPLHLTIALTLMIVLATLLLILCGWLVAPPGL
jgi:pSer/pThr/pTyr-binding forkhead associated (FHA) protein